MGVMSCSISNCDNIMCQTYVYEIGYICYECQQRFISWLWTQTPLYIDSDNFLIDKLKEFSEIDIENNVDFDENKVHEFFNKYTI